MARPRGVKVPKIATGLFVVLIAALVRGQDAPSSSAPEGKSDETPDKSQKAWNARKSYYQTHFLVVKKDGTSIRCADPFQVKDGRALFHILVNYKQGPLTSLPIDDIDLPATERANKELKEAAAAPPPKPPDTGRPLYDTKDISSALETPEMRAEREHIRKVREESRRAELEMWEESQKPEPSAKPQSAAREGAVTPEAMKLVKEHKVQKGMTSMAVVLSWGEPDKRQKGVDPDTGDASELWTYLVKGAEPFVLTLEKDAVVQIQSGDRLLFTASQEAMPTPSIPPRKDEKR